MNDKILTLLGFAAKAGKLSFGFDTTVTAMKKGNSRLVIAACDVSEKSKKEVSFFAGQNAVPFIIFEETDMKKLSEAVGRKCGIVSVNDSGFADACRKA